MTIDELFLFLLDDLEQRAQLGKGEYDALNMARILRELLLDGGRSVAIAVNRLETRRLRLRFVVSDEKPPPGIVGWGLTDAFDPAYAGETAPTAELTLDGFLGRTVLVSYSEHITVADLIRILANDFGAVHAGRPDDAKSEALRDELWGTRISTALSRGTYSGPVYSLTSVARVALKGLADLRALVAAETGWEAKPPSARGLGRHRNPEQRDLHPD